MANPFRTAATDVVRKATPSDLKDGDLTWYGDRGWSLMSGKRLDPAQSFETMVMEGFRKNPIVAECVRVLVGALSEAPIYAFRRSARGEWKRAVGHAAEELFLYPNPKDGYTPLIERAGQHFLLGGNAYWHIKRQGSGRPDGLVPIRPDRVISAVTDEDDNPLFFKVRRDITSTQTERIRAEDIFHVPDIDPLNEVFGVPRLLSAIRDTMTDNKATDYVGEVLTNHGSPGLVIGVGENVRSGQIQEAEDTWNEKFGPGKGRGKVGFIPGASYVKEIGFSLQALEFPSLRNVSRESICAAFGVDPILIGVGTASKGGTSAGAEHRAALRKLWTQTLIPMIRRWESVLNLRIAPEYGNVYLFFELDEVEALREARDVAFKRGKDMREASVYTYQEIRAETGHSPEPPANAVVVAQAGTILIPIENLKEGSLTVDGSSGSGANVDDDGNVDSGTTNTPARTDGDGQDGDEPDQRSLGSPNRERKAAPEFRGPLEIGRKQDFERFAVHVGEPIRKAARQQLAEEQREVFSIAASTLHEEPSSNGKGKA